MLLSYNNPTSRDGLLLPSPLPFNITDPGNHLIIASLIIPILAYMIINLPEIRGGIWTFLITEALLLTATGIVGLVTGGLPGVPSGEDANILIFLLAGFAFVAALSLTATAYYLKQNHTFAVQLNGPFGIVDAITSSDSEYIYDVVQAIGHARSDWIASITEHNLQVT